MSKYKLKLLSILLILNPVIVNAEDVKLNGTYINMGFGVSNQVSKGNSSSTLNIQTVNYLAAINQNVTLARSRMSGQVGFGYSYVFRNFYSAIEARIGKQSFKNTQTFSLRALFGGFPTASIDSTTSVKSSGINYAIVFKPGIVLKSDTILYGLAGIERRKFMVSTTLTANQNFGGPAAVIANGSESTNLNKVCMLIGAGMESYITNELGLGIEYVHAVRRNIKTPIISASFDQAGVFSGTAQNTTKIRAHTDSLLAKVTYHF